MRRANSRMPLTELWLSKVRAKVPPGANGYDSPTSRRAALALAVKMQRYSSGGALKNSQHAAAGCARTSSVDASDVGLFECGLPSTLVRSRSAWASIWLVGVQPAAGVVEVHLAVGVEAAVLGRRSVANCRRGRTSGTADENSASAGRAGRRAIDRPAPHPERCSAASSPRGTVRIAPQRPCNARATPRPVRPTSRGRTVG